MSPETVSTVPTAWRLGPGVRWLDVRSLAGGNPVRVVTMTTRGSRIVHDLLDGAGKPAVPAVNELLARLESAGLILAPIPPPTDQRGVTVVIPALSTAAAVRRLLGNLPPDVPVIVVDDGSQLPLLGLAAERHNLRVIRHDAPRGPAAARNAGAALVDTPWIVFLDADTLPEANWIAAMKAQIEQSDNAGWPGSGRVVLAAPRIYPIPGPGLGGWFEQRVVALDLGGVPSDVGIGRVVSYVPSAALIVDTETFRLVNGFDESMLVGEDVDLVWRIAEHGRIRYFPDIRVGHTSRASLLAALARRRVYGVGAADLGRRHGGAVRHVEASVFSIGPWLLGVAVNPLLGIAAAAVTAAIAHQRTRSLSAAHAHRLAVQSHLRAAGMLGRWLIRPMWPVTVIAALLHPALGRRLLLAGGIGAAYLMNMDFHQSRADGDTLLAAGRRTLESFAARTLDDAAYSIGIWQGVVTKRNVEPVLPRIRERPPRMRWPRATRLR